MPGDFEEHSQFQEVLQRQEPKRDGVSDLHRIDGKQRIHAEVGEQIKSNVQGKDGEDPVLAAHDEHDK